LDLNSGRDGLFVVTLKLKGGKMILESKYWKTDILRANKRLNRKSKQRVWSERMFVEVEKDIFISFYALRKLMDCQKISDEIANGLVTVFAYPVLGKHVTRMNWHEFFELYDLKNGRKDSIPLRTLCNQIIHSYVFMPAFNTRGFFNGIYITSDNHRNRFLYKVKLTNISKILQTVGNNYPSQVSMVFDITKKDFQVNAHGDIRSVAKKQQRNQTIRF
jgi:hypothetical protein